MLSGKPAEMRAMKVCADDDIMICYMMMILQYDNMMI